MLGSTHGLCPTRLLIRWIATWIAVGVAQGQTLESYPVTRVIDGDTIWIERDGRVEKLRLLSVDTEEKISGRPTRSRTKPETVLGEETRLWAKAFFAELAEAGTTPRVRLAFPDEGPERDGFGRLLCHVILPDGRDFNLLLVRLGLSPYFVKYGRSRVCHAEFVRAQAQARDAGRGIWRDAISEARRPYAALLAWWDARADAVDAFRRRRASGSSVIAADDPEQLAAAVERCVADAELELDVFGEIDRFFDEEDGSLTVLFRSRDARNAFRVRVDEGARGGDLERWLVASTGELVQNYLFVRGRIVHGTRGFRMVAVDAQDWRPAGPSPRPPGTTPSSRNMSTEIELKFAVEDESAFDTLIRHLDLPAREFHSSSQQVNHFFDTQTFALRDHHVTLRLREETGRYVLTLKGKATDDDGVLTERLEEEVRLAPNVALDVLQGSVSPRDALAARLRERNPVALEMLDETIGRNELHYVGRFENQRTRLSPIDVTIAGADVPLVFELDRTTFGPERIDYEIEVEIGADVDSAAATESLTALLRDAGVAWQTAPSKAQRFFELLR